MLNGDGNKNCKKIDSLISNKKQLRKCSTLFCTFPCRCFARPQRETFQLHILWGKNVVCAHQRFCSACVPVRYSFTAAHFYFAGFSLLTASISHFLTAPIKFSCFSSNENGFLCLSLALALVSTSRQTLKFSPKKDSWGTRLRCCFFSLPKSQGGHAIYHRNARVLAMRNLPLSYMKGWTYIRTIFSEIKFLGCIDNKIFLLKVLLFAHLKRESEADDNNNSNYSNNNNNK